MFSVEIIYVLKTIYFYQYIKQYKDQNEHWVLFSFHVALEVSLFLSFNSNVPKYLLIKLNLDKISYPT